MRRDWDFVKFADYASDMKESTDRSVAIISAMKARAEQAESVLAEVLLDIGRPVSVPAHRLHSPRRNIEMITTRDVANDAIVFEARRSL